MSWLWSNLHKPVIPDPKFESAIDYAKRIGTYDKDDRSQQYVGELDHLDGVLLRRKLQSKYDELFAKQRSLEKLKFRHAVVIIFIARAPEIIAWVLKVL